MNNINLIRKIAWSFHKTTGEDWEDLFQEAALGYLEAMHSYDPKRGKISTYMWWCVTSRLKTYLRKEATLTNHLCSIEDHPVDIPVVDNPLFESLTDDAQQIARTVLRCPKKFVASKRDSAYGRLRRVFHHKGWEKERVQRGIKDLEMVFSSL